MRGAFNAIRVVGDAVGPLMFHGQGAGQMPTASAVVADMIDMVVGRAPITFRNLELWSNQESAVRPLRSRPDRRGKFYLRFMAADQTRRAGRNRRHAGQARNFDRLGHPARRRSARADGFVPLVIMTHTATEGNVEAAAEAIDRLPSTRPISVRMRVHE